MWLWCHVCSASCQTHSVLKLLWPEPDVRCCCVVTSPPCRSAHIIFYYVIWHSGEFVWFVVKVVLLKIRIFWDVMSCCWVCSSWHFEQSWCLHHSFFLNCSTLKIKVIQSCEMSRSAHPLTQNHFPGDFKSSVKYFILHVCVAAGTNMCMFQLINVLSDRNLFTRHAMNMSWKGEELIINKWIEVMSNIVHNRNMSEVCGL